MYETILNYPQSSPKLSDFLHPFLLNIRCIYNTSINIISSNLPKSKTKILQKRVWWCWQQWGRNGIGLSSA